MSHKCSCCGKNSDIHLLIQCCVCRNMFNNACIGISTSETRLINGKKSLSWTCSNCHKVGNDINALKATIISLQEEVRQIKSNSQPRALESNKFIEEIISEVSERQRRKRNILIFNVKEERHRPHDEQNVADKNNIHKIVQLLVPSTKLNICNVFRLGMPNSSNTRPRPIKLCLTNEEDALKLLKKSQALKETNEFKEVFLTSDKTPREIEFYKSIKSEFLDRKNNGEDDIKIKYVDNVPKIVKIADLNLPSQPIPSQK